MSGEDEQSAEGGDTTPFRAWRLRNHLTPREAARRLGVPYTVVRGIDSGASTPNLRTTAKLVYGSGGALSWDDFLPPRLRTQMRRSAAARAAHRAQAS